MGGGFLVPGKQNILPAVWLTRTSSVEITPATLFPKHFQIIDASIAVIHTSNRCKDMIQSEERMTRNPINRSYRYE